MFRLATALVLAAGTAGTLSAQGWVETERPIRPDQSSTIQRVSSAVRTTIEGRIARVEVEERFRNLGSTVAEGSYLYPLPGEAVFQNFSLWMGEQEMRGEIMNADQARGIYEAIVRRRKDPALLTLAGHGLIRAQVFPIQPGETRRVVLRYTQLLERAGDAYRVRYAFGGRGTVFRTAAGDQPDRAPVVSYTLTAPAANGLGTPYSPTHRIQTRREHGTLDLSIEGEPIGDLEIFLPITRGLVGTSVVTHAPGGEDGYFMLLLAPPARDDHGAVPRDLTLVVDVSGSMSGEKMDQARTALLQALGTLQGGDRFRVIAFSNGVRQFQEGFVPATGENLRAAREFVQRLAPDGGTNIAAALEAALGSVVAEERLPIIVFLTDGIPSVGEQAPDRIAALAASRIGRARIFTVGIGHDVNTYLVDRLAREGRGTAEYVSPNASVEVAVGALMNKIRHPALVNLRLVDAPVELVELSPASLPDLFFGEELVVFGRYKGQGSGTVVLEGERNGRRERFSTRAVFPAHDNDADFIPRLWASRRIGELSRQLRLEGPSQALLDQVRTLGLRYGIVTEYTAYLVQEPEFAAAGGGPIPPQGRAAQAPSPAAQTGAVAFDRARESARLSRANTLAEADEAVAEKAASLIPRDARQEAGVLKRVGGRGFRLDGTVWTDVMHRDSLPVVDVAPYSDAFFELSRALPELVPSLQVGEEVLVAGRRISLRMTPAGVRNWKAGELARIVREFRGA